MSEEPGEQTTVVTEDRPLDASAIMQLATGYWSSAAFLAANDIGLFSALANGGRTAPEVAAALGADDRGTAALLDACCGLNVVVKQGEQYILPSISAAFLVPGSHNYLGSALGWARDQYTAWGNLAESVRTGKPAMDPGEHLGADPEQTRRFVLGMRDRAIGLARGVVRYLNLEGCRKLLDVGGGPGAYAMLLAQTYPELEVTILDLPGVTAVAEEPVGEAALTERIGTLAGDASFGDYGEDRFDAVLFSGVLHQMSPDTVRRMLNGAHRALTPGGRVLISDMMLDATKTQPVFSTLFSLQMLLTSREGGVFAAEECMGWLESAGFADIHIERLPPPLPYTVMTARK
jgi:3-hydroxy-5-methyl-1-naphthoate 3-O-methyltransferase